MGGIVQLSAFFHSLTLLMTVSGMFTAKLPYTVGNFTMEEFAYPTRLFRIGPYIALPSMVGQQVLTIWSSF